MHIPLHLHYTIIYDLEQDICKSEHNLAPSIISECPQKDTFLAVYNDWQFLLSNFSPQIMTPLLYTALKMTFDKKKKFTFQNFWDYVTNFDSNLWSKIYQVCPIYKIQLKKFSI